MESTFSWNCLLQIKPLCIWKRYTVLARHINKTYDQSNVSKFTELLLVIANEQAMITCSCWSCTISICLRFQIIKKKCLWKLLKLLCTRKPAYCFAETAYEREKRSNITKHNGLLLVAANEQSTTQGNNYMGLKTQAWFWLPLSPLHILGFLSDLDDTEDYMKTRLKCSVTNFFNRHFESFASYATATITKENGNHL